MKSDVAAHNRLVAQIAQARERPSFTTMLGLVQAIDACVGEGAGANPSVASTEEQASLVRQRLFRDSYDLCFSGYSRNPQAAAKAIRARAHNAPVLERRVASHRTPMVSEPVAETISAEWSATYHLAVATVLSQRQSADEGQHTLQSLMACLDLSYDNLGRMFDVSGETVRRWEKGTHPIPSERKAEITLAGAALERLLKMFRLERLPETLRRPAQLFDGKTALSWILQGRIAEVADRYEVLLRYQA